MESVSQSELKQLNIKKERSKYKDLLKNIKTESKSEFTFTKETMLSIRDLNICKLVPDNISKIKNRRLFKLDDFNNKNSQNKDDDVKVKEQRRGYSKNINTQIVRPEMSEGQKVILSEAKSMVWKDTGDTPHQQAALNYYLIK